MSGNIGTQPASQGIVGQEWFTTGGSSLNAIAFLIRQIVAGKAFAAVVQVKSVTNAGGLAPAGTVSVQPMVNQIDGLGNPVPHGVIYNLPYFRLQGCANAIVLDPIAGDIGVAVICDRDISVVKTTKKPASPGSRRQNSHADGLYLGGFLNGTPSNVVQFVNGTINVISPNSVTVQAPTINLKGNVVSTGTFTNNGLDISSTHAHSGVLAGSDDTGPPV